MGRKEQAEHVWENSAAADIKRIRKDDPEYPELLRQIDRPPEVLYCMGNTELLKKKCVAVVGARKASSYGKWAAYNIGKRLAEYGIVTVSGLAYGCDAEAHRGALEADGDTIAVMGCGVDICYPRNSRTLRDRIARQGLILSEYPPGTQPRTWMFPQRNRIISGISEAVAVAEAGLSSGSLITAACAAEQGKTLFAIPGNISAMTSIGCNKLIQDGAFPVAFIDDIISGIGVELQPEFLSGAREMGDDERAVYDILRSEGEVTAEYLAGRLKRRTADINAIVSVMEIKGFLVTSMGKIFIAK